MVLTKAAEGKASHPNVYRFVLLEYLPYAFALVVLFFLCATAFCAFSCAFTKVGAFSHGLDRCTCSCRRTVISLAANDWVRGMPYLSRYDFPSNPCSLRCLTDSCLKLAPHSRHVTVCLVMLFLQLTGFDGVSGVTTATLPFASSWALRACRLV
jgi:hypothetical protein